MIGFPHTRSLASLGLALLALSTAGLSREARAQSESPLAAAPAVSLIDIMPMPSLTMKVGGSMQKLTGVWVEGPGFEITYGGTYDTCSQSCLATPKCVMIEYYRPEKKCNLYSSVRPRISGGSSDVALRK